MKNPKILYTSLTRCIAVEWPEEPEEPRPYQPSVLYGDLNRQWREYDKVIKSAIAAAVPFRPEDVESVNWALWNNPFCRWMTLHEGGIPKPEISKPYDVPENFTLYIDDNYLLSDGTFKTFASLVPNKSNQ